MRDDQRTAIAFFVSTKREWRGFIVLAHISPGVIDTRSVSAKPTIFTARSSYCSWELGHPETGTPVAREVKRRTA
jgi:hypothetical protein